ncbi:hypothetical protein CCACVL1_16081 [Corchorus capsularis]|uniref:Uncharacterized protein n=1 Tax=Corchorus capsularis TaxID=210143 RepID=A0A1R3HZF2_COCAP|nr:hypothetical protein CCACVL1_16081 [Corchorus capsularis]
MGDYGQRDSNLDGVHEESEP